MNIPKEAKLTKEEFSNCYNIPDNDAKISTDTLKARRAIDTKIAEAQLLKAIPIIEKRTRESERQRILQIIRDWEGFSEEEWRGKYGRDYTELVDVIELALKEDR